MEFFFFLLLQNWQIKSIAPKKGEEGARKVLLKQKAWMALICFIHGLRIIDYICFKTRTRNLPIFAVTETICVYLCEKNKRK